MDHFELVSEYAPTGDQPQAIEKLVEGFQAGAVRGIQRIFPSQCGGVFCQQEIVF